MGEAPLRRIFKYGNEKALDVVLEVGDADFHVNKGALSVQSDFFYTLFNSDFKEKNEDRVKIEADVNAFQNLMEIIFKFRFKTNFVCPSGTHICSVSCNLQPPLCPSKGKMYRPVWANVLWNETVKSLELVELYQMTEVKDIIVKRLLDSNCKKHNCVNCALKIFLAYVCRNPRDASSPKITTFCAKKLFEWYSDMFGDFNINGAEIMTFLEIINF